MVNTCVYCGVHWNFNFPRTFHLFPSCEEKLQRWVRQIDLDISKLTKSAKLCSDHFEPTCFTLNGNRKQLLEAAVPTILGDRKSVCVFCNQKRNAERSLHRFPLGKTDELQKWLENIPLTNYEPSEKSVLCSDHFEKKCFKGKKHLKPNSIPTVFILSQSNAKFHEILTDSPPKRQKIEECIPTIEESEKLLLSVEVDDIDIKVENQNSLHDEEQENSQTPKSVDGFKRRVLSEHNYEMTSRSTKKKLQKLEWQLHRLRKQNKAQKNRIKRQEKKIENLKDIVRTLKDKALVSENALVALDSIADSDLSALILCFLQNSENKTRRKERENIGSHVKKRFTRDYDSNAEDRSDPLIENNEHIDSHPNKMITRDYDSNSEDRADPLVENHENVNCYDQKSIRKPLSEDRGDALVENVHNVESQRDDYQIFGDYIASEFRSLRNDHNRRLLRLKIQRAILDVADIDNRDANAKVSNLANLLPSSTSIQLKEGHQGVENVEYLVEAL